MSEDLSAGREPAPPAAPGPRSLPRPFVVAVAIYSFLLICGMALGYWLQTSPISEPLPGPFGNVFYFLFAYFEPVACVLNLCVLAGLILFLRSRFAESFTEGTRPVPARPVVICLLGVLLITAAGTVVIFHSFPLAMDEYLAEFQARLFTAGKVFGRIPMEWQPFAPALTPIFVVYDATAQTWVSAYLPVYAAMRAVASMVGAQGLLNPGLAALGVAALAGVAGHLWPDAPRRRLLAALLLASSSQFLLTSMTAYSMPAHLCLNLCWLWLFTRPGKEGKVLAPWVGILATGLHQPNVHLLFAFPFCVRLVRERRWGMAAYYLLMYVMALFLWSRWWALVRPGAAGESANFLQLPGLQQLVIQGMNVVLTCSWHSAALIVLAGLALSRWRSLQPALQDAAWSCLLTFAFYIFFASDQGHGWGYRYFYPVLGCLVLLACGGWEALREQLGSIRARNFVLGSAMASLIFVFPLRSFQTEGFVRPFAKADGALQDAPFDVVLIQPFTAWYAQDLVRNDPLFEASPKVMRTLGLGEARFRLLQEGRSVTVVPTEALAGMGLRTQPLHNP